jgi:hypothetical protein
MIFGRRWSQALTVTILKRHERSFAAAGPGPARESRLRVRASRRRAPEQIEIAEGK